MATVYTVEQLAQLAKEKRSVIGQHGWSAQRPCPAAVIMSMQAKEVLKLLDNGLFVYERRPDRKAFPKGGIKKRDRFQNSATRV